LPKNKLFLDYCHVSIVSIGFCRLFSSGCS